MNNPLLSICIPTYNREKYLKECLDSIVCQFDDPEIYNQVEIIISDNASEDNTTEMVAEYQKRYGNIKYFRNGENIGSRRNIISVAGLAVGQYVWVFSDDDLQTKDSLKIIIEFIRNNHVDFLLCNLIGFNEKYQSESLDLLKISKDVVISSRKDFFSFLNKKIYSSIDYYTTFCSNQIFKKEIFDNNYYIFEKFNGHFDEFPFPSLIFYSDIEFRTGVISRQIILNRSDNESWGSRNKIKRFIYRDRIWRDYYKKIIENNKEILPKGFIFRVEINNLLRIWEFIKIIIVHFLRKIKIYDKLKRLIKKVK